MSHVEADRVKETTTTTGTGPLTLAGAVAGFRTFASQLAAADTCFYCVVGGGEWEVGLGTFNGTLARTSVLSSSNANAPVSFSAGAKEVFITLPAARTATFSPELALELMTVTAEPATPAADTALFYAKKSAGRTVPKFKGPSGLDYPLQASFWQNNIVMWNLTNVTGGVWLGTSGQVSGTYGTVLPVFNSTKYASVRRSRWANVVTTLNQVIGQRQTELMYGRGSVAGVGGFNFYARGGADVWTNGCRFFAGLTSNATGTPASTDPSTVANTCGFCVDAADNGAISFMTRDGAAVTKTATGYTMATGKGFDFYMFCAPNSNKIDWRIVDINAETEASGSATTNLPVSTVTMCANFIGSNAAVTPVSSIMLTLNRIYVETDY